MTDSNPTEGGAQTTAPLTPSFIVWPGKAHGQTWMLLWISVAYFVGAILPWEGAGQVTVVLDAPAQFAKEAPTTVMSMAQYEFVSESANRRGETAPNIVQIMDDRGMSLGRFLILLGGIAMIISSLCNIWTRRLNVTPTLLTWFEGLVILYFFTSTKVVTEGGLAFETVGGFAGIGTMFSAGLGSIGEIFGGGGDVSAATLKELSTFGLGFYVTALAQIGTILLILAGIFFSGKKSGGDEAPKGGGKGGAKSGGASRPGRRPMPAADTPDKGDGAAD